MINIQQGMSPQLYKYAWTQQLIQQQRTTSTTTTTSMTMYNINNNVQLQYYNLIDIHQVNSTYAFHIIVHQHINIHVIIHHLIATSYNHHVNSTYAFHIIVHQHIYK